MGTGADVATLGALVRIDYRVLPAGDTAIVIEFGEDIDRRVNAVVLALNERLAGEKHAGILETVPTFRSLMVYYDPVAISQAALAELIARHIGQIQVSERPSRTWRLPVCYDTEMAPDLSDVAARAGLTIRQAIERHSGLVYHIYMLGFLPGLAYMGDVPPELVVPRLQTPRLKIPAGSLGIAMAMSLIMPRETASGLNLIGRSPVPMWQPGVGAFLKPGDKVTHQPISPGEYNDLAARAEAGTLRIEPETENLETAA
jgi:KipI family sensor histidine kinase inhibitor